MLKNLSGNERALALLLGFLLIIGLMDAVPLLGFLLIIFAVMYASRSGGSAGTVDVGRRRRPDVVVRQQNSAAERPRRSQAERVQAHAIAAVRQAGLNPNTLPVLPVDIGLISFHGDTDPVVHRNWPLDDDCDYIQPFVELRVPQAATGRVRFEIVDRRGEVLFVHEENYELKRGRNFVMPAARLPIHDERALDGDWSLRVSADGVRLADHQFEWTTSSSGIDRHIGEDGEINSELRAVLAQSRLQPMSLDDLLGDEADDDDEAAIYFVDEEARRSQR